MGKAEEKTTNASGRTAGGLFVPVRGRNVREEIIRQIEEHMVSGQLRSREKLPAEREMSRQFGVSRTALREALTSLEEIGLVSRGSRGSRYVRGAAGADSREWVATGLVSYLAARPTMAFEPLEVRRIIEPETARLAAKRAKDAPALIAEMASILRDQDASIERGEIAVEEDIRFHTLIASASGNSLIEKIVGVMNEAMRDWKRKTLELEDRGAPAAADHWEIWRAIAAGDEERAYERALHHIELSQERILRYLSQADSVQSLKAV